MPLFLLNPKLWIAIGILGLLTIGAMRLNAWDNARLDAAYEAGRIATTNLYVQEMDRIERQTDEITKMYATELQRRISAEQAARNPNLEAITTYVKETVFSCTPDPKYLQLWDNSTADPSLSGQIRTASSEFKEVRSPAETAR